VEFVTYVVITFKLGNCQYKLTIFPTLSILHCMIYIYDDGVHANAHVQIAVNIVAPDIDVRFCTAPMILDGCLNHAQLLIIPGGADLYNCEKLNGKGNQTVRDFVAQGGSYLGICAGAYYGCTSLNWACGEINGSRELAFYEGKAIGPIYDWIENKDSIYEGSWIYAAKIETDSRQKFLTQYNGGPIFTEDHECEVIARYNDLGAQPPAIIGRQFGEGKYILSSPHIENFGHLLSDRLYKHLNNSYNRERDQIDKLLAHEQDQKDFFKDIINRLL
jgi:glutamine amidotransferase-like uncharacterized protein